MSIIVATLKPTYDVYSTWYREPDSAEPNTNWQVINKEDIDDTKYIYEWLSASPWFDEEQIYLCNEYSAAFDSTSELSVLISVRAKAVPTNPLLTGLTTLRVYYCESEFTDTYFTDFILSDVWTTQQIEIPFDWGVNLITNIRFKAKIEKRASNLYISQIHFDLIGW